jgi:hypothetical protein
MDFELSVGFYRAQILTISTKPAPGYHFPISQHHGGLVESPFEVMICMLKKWHG